MQAQCSGARGASSIANAREYDFVHSIFVVVPYVFESVSVAAHASFSSRLLSPLTLPSPPGSAAAFCWVPRSMCAPRAPRRRNTHILYGTELFNIYYECLPQWQWRVQAAAQSHSSMSSQALKRNSARWSMGSTGRDLHVWIRPARDTRARRACHTIFHFRSCVHSLASRKPPPSLVDKANTLPAHPRPLPV